MDLRFFRYLAGKTQRDLGRRVGSCQSQIHLIEAGYAFPSEEQKTKIATALGVSVTDIDWPQKMRTGAQPPLFEGQSGSAKEASQCDKS